MGCYSVACTVSHLSINSGDRVVYIPLLPKHWGIRNYPGQEHHLVGTHSNLIYSNCYFNPLTLPIKGQYNDYGALENVDRDANTEAIETFFNMPVEDFVKTIERNWCREYLNDQKKLAKNFIKNHKEFNNVSNDDLTEEFMLKMGFVKIEEESSMPTDSPADFEMKVENFYIFKDFPYKVAIRGDGKAKDARGYAIKGYEILEKDTDKKVKFREHSGFYKNYLLSDFAELTDYYLGIPEDFQEKVHIMENCSGMFIHEDVYNTLCEGSTRAEAPPEDEMLLDLGFILDENKKKDDRDDRFYYHPEVKDTEAYICVGCFGSPQFFDRDSRDKCYCGHWLKSSYELAEDYIEKHGVILDLTPYEKESCSMPIFRKLQKKIKEYDRFEGLDFYAKGVSLEIREAMLAANYFHGHPLSKTALRDGGLMAFDGWDCLKDIYLDYFKDGSISQAFCEWIAAKNEMFSANVFFFPAMSGEQHGNDLVSKRVLKASLAVIEEREKKYKEENCV